jgi:hypothetical protein
MLKPYAQDSKKAYQIVVHKEFQKAGFTFPEMVYVEGGRQKMITFNLTITTRNYRFVTETVWLIDLIWSVG